MENKYAGWFLLGVVVLLVIIILLFNSTLNEIVAGSCTLAHGDANSCPMYKTISRQTYLSLAIVGLLIIVSLFLIFSKPKERVVFKKIKLKKKKVDISDLRQEDKLIYKFIQNQGTIFQADLIEKSGYGKAKVSRIIDRLEGKGLVERKRRGMTNVVVLKDN